MIDEKIFKAYDIRGIYPDQLNEKAAQKIGRAFVKKAKPKKIVVGRDMRLASPKLLESFINGVLESGTDVDNIGETSVDALYYALGKYNYEGGVYCTASHNPKEYHGFKMFANGGKTVIRGLDLKEIALADGRKKSKAKGKLKNINIDKEFIEYLLTYADLGQIKPLKVVVDAGNGMAGKIMPILKTQLPVTIYPLFFELDGNFPNHPSNPLEPQSQVAIKEKVLETNADFGVIFDGDTDRLFFVDENGEFIKADITLLILAKHFLEANPGASIAYNAICSKAVPKFIKDWGGKPIRTKVGFVNVQEALLKHGAVMGGELSAHYCFKDNYNSDSGFIAFLIMLRIISKTDKKLSEIVKELTIYSKANEVNVTVEDTEAKINAVKKKYQDGKQDFLDGITVEYKDWWFNVRPSNTEPLLRITIEADNKKLLEEKSEELINFIKNN